MISSPTIHNVFKERPALNFQGVFFTLAIKEGGSQRIHLDWTDHPWTYAWIMLAGEAWKGGELCLPQLGRKIPTCPGQVIAFTGRTLAHFSASYSEGRRLLFTGFTDSWIMNHTHTFITL